MARSKRSKPVTLLLTPERAELLTEALAEQRMATVRELRLMRLDPNPSKEDKYNIELNVAALLCCDELRAEVRAYVTANLQKE